MDMGPIGWIILGLLAGALSGAVVGGRTARGCLPNIIVGIIGAFVGGYLFRAAGVELGGGLIGSLIVAFVGAVLLLFVVRLFTGRRSGRRLWS